MPYRPLRLLAQDQEDLQVISAALQDAVAKIGDISFDPKARALTIAFNRFRWEKKGAERVRAGLRIDGVLGIQSRKLRRNAKQAVVELLAITFEPGEAPGGVINLTFAGGGDLRCDVECIDVALADVTRPWPARERPKHAGT
jgi:hypothetical protein